MGIVFRPQYYMFFIHTWNAEHTNELPITVTVGNPMLQHMIFHSAGENLSEIDVICHLASCAITQDMIDSAYPWAMIWIDQHSSNMHFCNHNIALEMERLDRICCYGKPVIATSLCGWWSPDKGDTH